MSLELRVLRGVDEVPEAEWDALAGEGSPFLEWGYLRAVEAASAIPRHGVVPCHVTAWRGRELVGAVPLYLKRDGRGEFIYDFDWYGLSRRLRAPYYPKLVSMGPFAPFEVPHLLVRDPLDPGGGEVRAALLERVEARVGDDAAGLHWLYVGAADAGALVPRGYVRRASLELVWEDRGHGSFDGWLAALRSKERVRTRRELRRVEEAGVTLETVEGEAITPDDLDLARRYYEATCEAHGTGSDYLKPGTWALLHAWRRRLVLFFAREGGRRVGGALLVTKGTDLYGRYWGAEGDRPFLYFTLCAYRPLQHALARGLRRVFPGAGVSFHKHARGFAPRLVTSLHRVSDDRLQGALAAHAAAEEAALRRLLASAGDGAGPLA
jgi:predicted N-acyltransferase